MQDGFPGACLHRRRVGGVDRWVWTGTVADSSKPAWPATMLVGSLTSTYDHLLLPSVAAAAPVRVVVILN